MRLALTYQRVDPTKGGAETYVADLCRRLIALGHEVDLLASQWRDGVLPRQVQTIKVEPRGWTKLTKIWNFAVDSEALRVAADRYDCTVGFINTWGDDVMIPQGGVHAASLQANARRFREGWARRLYTYSKQINPKQLLLYRAIERRQYDPARGTKIVAVSKMVETHLTHYLKVTPDRVRVIPNAIDAHRLHVGDPEAVRRAFRHEHGLRPDDLTALFVGHNFWLKGLKPLLEALKLRFDRTPDCRPIHLLVCGGGNLNPFRRMVDELGLGRFVKLIGFQADIRPSFHASDFFVSPTYYDPCSLVVFEALACGLPVITTGCNGAGELITEGHEGFIVEHPELVDRLATALDQMTDDRARANMAKAAVILGREQSFDQHVSRLITVFEEVAFEKKARTLHTRRSALMTHRKDLKH